MVLVLRKGFGVVLGFGRVQLAIRRWQQQMMADAATASTRMLREIFGLVRDRARE